MDAEERKRQAQAREIAARIVGGGDNVDSLQLEPLEGMTNRNYRIVVAGVSYVGRIPGEGTEEYIDRKADGQAARVTSEIGVNAPVIHYDDKTGTQITRFIENARTFRTPGTAQDPKALARAARAFHRLHTSGKSFLNR